MMSGIKGKDTKPELVVRRYLHSRGLRFRLHVRDLPGRPDLVFPKFSAVVQVQGCFWHRHKGCPLAYTPASNRAFWLKKLRDNARRDTRNDRQLRALGWRVISVWECEVRDGSSLIWLDRAIRRRN
jgi:DNA mismatch endonuclease (patch repair protein)